MNINMKLVNKSNPGFRAQGDSRIKFIPIDPETKLTPKKVQELLSQATPDNLIGEGYNGRAYEVGLNREYVLKQHKGAEAKAVKDPNQEAGKLKALQALHSHRGGTALGASQKGIAQITTGSGDNYLLSTKVPGEIVQVNGTDTNLKPEHLDSLVKICAEMDKGTSQKGSYMHYDMGGVNINITPDGKLGLFDWEYLRTIPLVEKLQEQIEFNSNISDTLPNESSMRNAEHRLLYPLMTNLTQAGEEGSERAKQLYETYLPKKAKYHQEMASYYGAIDVSRTAHKEARKLGRDDEGRLLVPPVKFRQVLSAVKPLAQAEKAHSNLLKAANGETPEDIKRAELQKIQLCSIAFQAGPYCADGNFNGEQVGQIYDRSKQFFETQLEKAKQVNDKDRELYYTDSLRVLHSFDRSFNQGVEIEADGPAIEIPVRKVNLTTPNQIDLPQIFFPEKE